MTVPWPSHTLHGPRSMISPRQLHPLDPLQHSVSNLPEPPQPGQMISLCPSISTRPLCCTHWCRSVGLVRLRFVRRCQKRPSRLSSLLWCECNVRVVAHLQLDVYVMPVLTPVLRWHYHPRRDWRRLVPVSVDRHARIDSHPALPPLSL